MARTLINNSSSKKQADEMASKMGKRNKILRSLSGRSWGPEERDPSPTLCVGVYLSRSRLQPCCLGTSCSTIHTRNPGEETKHRCTYNHRMCARHSDSATAGGGRPHEDPGSGGHTDSDTIRLPDNIPSKSTATGTDLKIKFAEFKKPEKKMCPPERQQPAS